MSPLWGTAIIPVLALLAAGCESRKADEIVDTTLPDEKTAPANAQEQLQDNLADSDLERAGRAADAALERAARAIEQADAGLPTGTDSEYEPESRPLREARGPTPALARTPLYGLLSSDDYPAAALDREEEGRVTFRLVVGPSGRVDNCTIVLSSGSSTLDAATCRIMQSRARFAPARSADGSATTDAVTASINWRLSN